MSRFCSVDRLVGLSLTLALGACTSEKPEPLPSHPAPVEASPSATASEPSGLSLEREAEGPYLEGGVESFRVVFAEPDVESILWSASGGKLESREDRATWTLPRSGPASLTVSAVTKAGRQLSETWQFQVARAASSDPEGGAEEPVSLGTPTQVESSPDETGFACDLAFDATGKGHIIYLNTTHPSLWYGTWNGSAWTTELVDGAGFNVGGFVDHQVGFVLDPAGNPHIVYRLVGRGVWYATRSGGNWIRERVDSPTTRPSTDAKFNAVAIALDPSLGNRPTIAYQWTGIPPGETNSRGRVVIAYRTGAAAWTSAPVKFLPAPSTDTEALYGDILFQSNGTLLLPHTVAYLGSWKADGSIQNYLLNGGETYGNDPFVSMTWAAANRLVLRAPFDIFDVTLASPLANSTYKYSVIEDYVVTLGDIVFTGGKPSVAHYHGGTLELVTPDAQGYWTYTQLGSASQSRKIGLAVRPTTGQLHVCYQLNGKVMFQ